MPQENPNQKPSETGAAGGAGEGGQGAEGGAPGATLSMEDVEKLVDARVNGALTTHFNRFKGVMAKDVEGQVSKGLNPVLEKLTAMEAAFKERPAAPPAGDQPLSAAVDAATRKADARIKELEAKADAAEKARAESEMTRLQQEERSALASALGAAGVEGVKQNVLIAYLHKEKAAVRRNDKGEVCLRLTRPYGEDDVPLAEAIPEWLKTAEGKEFAPPRPTGGSGASGGKAQGKGGPAGIKEAAQSTVLRAFGFKQ